MRNSRRMREPTALICTSSPLRSPMLWNTGPVPSSGTSTISRSTGSYSCPSMVLYRTFGVLT